jgi:translocator protein
VSGRGRHALALVGWLAISYVPALVGRLFQPGAWYASLEQPAWAPPDWVFGPVWTALYATMGVAAWLVWRTWGFTGARLALGLYVVQLVLNGMWSWIFFGLQRPGLALVEILALWVAIVATTVAFWRIRRPAGLLLLPYLAWVAFAALLNAAIWRLNA